MSYKNAETDKVRLRDILKAIEDAHDFSKNGLDDRQAMMATAYMIAIMGEAANHLTEELINTHSHIPWRDIIGMRHRIIHGYGQVNRARLQEVIDVHLSVFEIQIKNVLELLGD